MLTLCRVLLRFLAALDGAIDSSGKLGASAHRVKRPGLDQRFQHALVQEAQIHLFAELPKSSERASLLFKFAPRRQDGFDSIAADILDRRQTKPNPIAMRC